MIIKVGLVESQLLGSVSEVLKHKLRASLSYENRGQIIQRLMYMRKYGKKAWQLPPHLRWNGITCLLSETNKFPTGCLSTVKDILRTNNIEFEELVDYKVPAGTPISLAKEITLWDHQRDAIEAIKSNLRGIIRIGTGGGKTIMSIVATAEIGQLPVLFVVNRVSLLKQAHHDYEQFLGQKVGFIGDGQMTFGKVNIATIHTLCSILKIEHDVEAEDKEENVNYTPEQIKMLHLLLKATRLVIIDECHHAASDMYIKLMKELPSAAYRIGLSATPFRTDGLDILLEGAFGRTLYTMSASELIQTKVLAKPYITFLDYDDPLTKNFPYLTPAEEAKMRKAKKRLPTKARYNTVYKECVVDNVLFNTIVARIALEQASLGLLTLISVKQVAHGEKILKIMKAIDPNAKVEFLHGGNKDKLNEDTVKADFASHKIQVLISTLFDEGVDIPAIDVAIDAGGGMALPNDSKVATPNGWKAIGDLTINDKVIGSNGKPVEINAIYNEGYQQAYKIVFSDGSQSICSGKHLWNVYNSRKSITNRRFQTLATDDLYKRYQVSMVKYAIPIVSPVEYPERRFKIDPYILGVLLGDGSFSNNSCTFTSCDKDLIDEVANLLPCDFKLKLKNKNYKQSKTYDCTIVGLNNQFNRHTANWYNTEIKRLNLWNTRSNNKFIPDEYLLGSIEQRISLLQGLFDTDGNARDRKGYVEYTTTSSLLADGITSLVQSLGGVVSKSIRLPKTSIYNGREICGRYPVNRLFVKLPPGSFVPFRLKRKNLQFKQRVEPASFRIIRSVEKLDYLEKMTCLNVNANDGLFLTENYILTHNSPIKTLQLVGRAMRKYPGKEKAYIFVFIQRYTHLYNHSVERLKILKTEPEFEIKVLEWPKKTPS